MQKAESVMPKSAKKLVTQSAITLVINRKPYYCAHDYLRVLPWLLVSATVEKESLYMPRGPKGEKRPGDLIGAAIMVARIATAKPVRDDRSTTSFDPADSGRHSRTF